MSNPRLYFEPVQDETRKPPVFAVIVSSIGGDRHQIGPIVLTGETEEDRKRQSRDIFREVLTVYGVEE